MRLVTALAAGVLLLGLPLLGAALRGQPLAPYLTFPALPSRVTPAPFAWPAFVAVALLLVASVAPFAWRVLHTPLPPRRPTPRWPFPWWGWAGLALGAGAWGLAWSRGTGLAPWRAYTFTPLWVAYVLVVNACTYRRTGHCLLRDRPRFAGRLLPLSALFWWYFEYLNRFVHNWSYLGLAAFPPWQYGLYATVPFATVLPAVLSTYELLRSVPRLSAGLDRFCPLRVRRPRRLSGLLLLASGLGLVGVGAWPQACFALVWVAPLGVFVACQGLAGRRTVFSPVAHGDWRRLWLWALAGVMCGLFWELWNAYSQVKWVYAIPFVDRFRLFEMPLLGYGGYLPFGLTCAVAVDALASRRPAARP